MRSIVTNHYTPPHSLGKLIEWKDIHQSLEGHLNLSYSPHSLGKLIEWKAQEQQTYPLQQYAPHSLGKLIEWKVSP
jgi:hypothetical protein